MARILQVFNRYLHMGGEEKSVDRIFAHLGEDHPVERCFFDSRDWTGPGAPGRIVQLRKTFYNLESRRRLEEAMDRFRPDVLLFHNAFPVGSPSVYHAAKLRRVPIIHYVHNFRPFSVGGTLYHKGQFFEEALRGNYLREVATGAWQGSRLKSAVMALVLRRLHASGWLGNVQAWVCISEFLKTKLVAAGVPADRLHALRHSWDPLPAVPGTDDEGYYLFLGRLVDVKGVAMLLEAWREVCERLGPAAPELHLGGEGPLEGLVRNEAAANPKVKFLGLVQGLEKKQAILGCRAMVAPSVWWEPLGLVTYEAYDYGKPMLAARSGGLAETVLPGVSGLLHEPGNVPGLVEDVLALEARSATSRREMGAAGRAWLLRDASPGAWKQSFEGILTGVLDQSRGRQ